MIDTPEEKDKFECLYLKYRDLMFYIANKILQNKQDAEDAVHAAFVSVAENIEKVSSPDCPKTKGYIVTITENKAIDLYRKKKRHSKVLLLEETAGLDVSYEELHAIARCFARLSSRDRDILMLRYRYGYTAREIAKLLAITEANAGKRIQRAKDRLEKLCKEEGFL
jgi:RNA polymerase sigma-70 factor (ECF subfamily)